MRGNSKTEESPKREEIPYGELIKYIRRGVGNEGKLQNGRISQKGGDSVRRIDKIVKEGS
jgi:hypothetical protein